MQIVFQSLHVCLVVLLINEQYKYISGKIVYKMYIMSTATFKIIALYRNHLVINFLYF